MTREEMIKNAENPIKKFEASGIYENSLRRMEDERALGMPPFFIDGIPKRHYYGLKMAN